MCEKAVEVQELWNLNNRDFWIARKERKSLVERIEDLNTWIPRQDQLQGMIIGKEKDISVNILNLHAKFNHFLGFVAPRPLSMEQLWFAFVMKEKFNKTWDGEDWRSDEKA